MEQNKPGFRLKLNLFDGIVLVLAVLAAAFLLWRAMKPAAVGVSSNPVTTSSTIRYTVRFQRWLPGTSEIIHPNDRLADNIKNYEVGRVVSAEAVPALMQVADEESRRWVWTELEGFEDVLVTVEAPCTVSERAFTVGGGYEVRVGSSCFLRGEGYMGSGPIVSLEEVKG